MRSVFSCILALYCSLALAQSNIPIDSPRGSYVGAENIHWYQQLGLRESDVQGFPVSVRGGDAIRCDQDVSVDCLGVEISIPQPTYFRMGNSVIKVAVFVDTRQTSGFDFRWRRAVDAIRRANDAFRRSGADVTLSIVSIEDFDFDAKGYAYDPFGLFDDIRAAEISFLDAKARDTEADTFLFVRNAQGQINLNDPETVCGAAVPGLNDPASFIASPVFLSCEDAVAQQNYQNTPYLAAHEFGHVLGLVHQDSARAGIPFVSYGGPFFSEGIGTIMSQGGFMLPFFSSPLLMFEGALLGDVDTANAVQAINQAAATVSLHWERRWGGFNDAETVPASELAAPAPRRLTPMQKEQLIGTPLP